MKTRLEQVLERNLNGREIAVWGNPTRYMLRVLKPYKFQITDIVDPIKHYVVAANEDDFDDFLLDAKASRLTMLTTALFSMNLANRFLSSGNATG